jgi:hypothetical protein
MVIGFVLLAIGLALLHRTTMREGPTGSSLVNPLVMQVGILVEAGLAIAGLTIIGKQFPLLAILIFVLLMGWTWLVRAVASDRRIAATIFRTYNRVKCGSPSVEEDDVLRQTARISLARLGWPSYRIEDSIKRWFPQRKKACPSVRDPVDIAALFLVDMKPGRDTIKMYRVLAEVYEKETGIKWPPFG